MNFFGLGGKKADITAAAPPSSLRATRTGGGTTTIAKDAKPSQEQVHDGAAFCEDGMPSSEDATASSNRGLTLVSALAPQIVINTLADFPRRDEVLTGSHAREAGLSVPVQIQDYVIVIKIAGGTAVLVYEPGHLASVKDYFAGMRNAVATKGLRMQIDPLFATSDVIRDVRLDAESKQSKQVGSGTSSSNGAILFKEFAAMAIEAGATDIHMALRQNGTVGYVSCRVDGKDEPIDVNSQGIYTGRDVLAAMTAAYDKLGERLSNSGGTFSASQINSIMIESKLGIPNIRLRFTSQQGMQGPKAVSRILHTDLNAPPMPFATMGLADSQIALLEQAQRLQKGMVLQMGVTGSGKTTVAKTFVETHPLYGKAAFYEVGDPIEYFKEHVHQVPIQRDLFDLYKDGQKDPYSAAIQALMRMDPDLIDAGEARDVLSAKALATIAKTGHIALGTLHAENLQGTISRLVDLGLTRQELTSGNTLRFISLKSLVPKLCSCAVDHKAAKAWYLVAGNERDARYIDALTSKLEVKYGLNANIFKFYNHEGCPVCRGRGTKGLTMLAEMMMPDDDWLDLSATGNDRAAMRQWRMTYSDKNIHSPDMSGKLIAEHATYKAIQGLIDPRVIEAYGPLDSLEVLRNDAVVR